MASFQPEPLICVDIGNSLVKLAIARTDDSPWSKMTCLEVGANIAGVTDRFQDWIEALDIPTARWRFCSVNRPVLDQFNRRLQTQRPDDPICELDYRAFPGEVQLPQPARVGVDRLMAAAGAMDHASPGGESSPLPHSLLIVDVGTAVTIDAVDRGRHFLGGVIRPGTGLQRAALHRYTDALPDLSHASGHLPDLIIGDSTEAAILSGTSYGEAGAIMALVELMTSQLDDAPAVYVTGGGADELEIVFPDSWIRRRALVLDGIRSASFDR